jgi:hypothetical protein
MREVYVKPIRDIAARMLAGEVIVMSVRDSRVFSLNSTASAIWSGADGITPLREIVRRRIVAEFEVDADTAYQDAVELVEELAREGIMIVADHPIGAEAT